MSLSDPVADMLTRIRNAQKAEHDVTEMPSSKLKIGIATVLKNEGYVRSYSVEGDVKKVLKVYLKYTLDGVPAIRGLRRESKPGLRIYKSTDDLPKVLGGLGVAVLSTSAGVMTGKQARGKKTGGEYICSVW
jgi:small subunit ribosomal protein S8